MERLVLGVVFLTMLAGPIQARTWIVSQNGDGDAARVTDALAAASANDSILIRPGSYDEVPASDDAILVRDKPLTIMGTGLRREDTSVRISIFFRDCGFCRISNVTFRDAEYSSLSGNGDFTVRDCIFEQNTTMAGGAAISSSGSLVLEDCTFKGNRAEHGPVEEMNYGGAIWVAGPTAVRRCRFVDNYAAEWGGAICSIGGSMLVEDTIFYQNRAPRGAAIMAWDADIRGSTFLLNEVVGGSGACVEAFYFADWSARMSHCIVAQTVNGVGLECAGVKILECCDVWGNDGGDYGGRWCENSDWMGDFSADPMFCDAGAGDVGLLEGSPCLPGTHGTVQCGLVGARGLVCNADPVKRLSWGQVRSLFR